MLRISALNHSQLFAAASVTLRHSNSSESELEPMHLPDVAAVLKRNIVNQVYRKGSELYLNFFNKPLTFRMESWQGVEEDALEDALANLSLANTQQFVQITNATRLEILLNEEQVEEQQPELDQGLSKAKIGGLDKQIQLVEESMDFALGYKPMPKGKRIYI